VRIAVLTGGGDAAGLNAAIRSVGRSARAAGHWIVGVKDGWAGLLEPGRLIELTADHLESTWLTGGTLVGSSRTNPLSIEGGLDTVMATMATEQVDGLVAIGGDDTLSVAAALAGRDVRVVGIPKTVDYDLSATEYCIGFDTAVAVIAEAVERLTTTAASHHRVLVCEVMGRHTGWLALMGGLAGGANVIVIPEFALSIDEIARRVLERRRSASRSTVIVVAEGSVIEGLDLLDETDASRDAFGHVALADRKVGDRVAAALTELTGAESRSTALGHVQRGGPPVAADRIWASRLGIVAVEALTEGATGVCAVVSAGAAALVPLDDVVAETKRVPEQLWNEIDRLL
jgi:6-phosphofructokinase 1